MTAAVSIINTDHEDNTLAHLVEGLEARDSQDNPDRCVPLGKVRMTAAGTLVLPGVQGTYALTEWSRGQLSRAVGLNWEKFFENAKPNDIAEEMNRRFSRATEVVKLRSASRVPQDIEANGTVTALVSPSYSPVPDGLVGGVLRDALVSVQDDTRVVRSNVTDLTTSFVVTVGDKLTPSAKVGSVQGCIYMKNSGVGYSKLCVQLALVRLVCSNGLLVSLPGAVLVRSVHRGLDLGRVRERLVAGLRDLPALVNRSARMLAESTTVEVANVELEVRDLLREARLPLRLVAPVLSAYLREPSRTRFGLVQAVTLASQGESPEVRYEMDKAAGLYLAAS